MTEIKRYCDICHKEMLWHKEMWYELEVTFHTYDASKRLLECCGVCGNALMVHIQNMKEDFRGGA